MTLELLLNYHRRFAWKQNGNLFEIGYGLMTGQDSAEVTIATLSESIAQSNGCFAAVYVKDDQLSCWVDTAASFPLFYKITDGHLVIADFEGSLPIAEHQLSPEAKSAFLNIYCTEGTDTLLKDWKAIPAGHQLMVNLEKEQIDLQRYFHHFEIVKQPVDQIFVKKCRAVFESLTRQMLQFCAEKMIVLPLSGGYDSRLILSMLVKGGHPNILCYTYGHPDSHEMMLAKQVTSQLQVRHICIQYDQEIFRNYESEDWKIYEKGNHHFQSLPHEQDYFALFYLRQNGYLEQPFVAIPGYCGDIAGGSFLKDMEIEAEQYVKKITNYAPRHLMEEPGVDPWDIYQQWLAENRLSKFIVNSVRVFEHFGGQWMLPLWHQEFLRLFYSVEYAQRLNEKAYLDIVFQLYFEPLNIAFRKPGYDSATASRTWKDDIKKKLPQPIVAIIRQVTQKRLTADPCNLQLLYDIIYENMERSGKYKMPEKNYNINYLRAYKWLNDL